MDPETLNRWAELMMPIANDYSSGALTWDEYQSELAAAAASIGFPYERA